MNSNDHFVCPPITTADAVFLAKVEAAHELAAEISKNKQLTARIEALELDLCFCREAMRHADIDLSMILPDVGLDMQKEIRKTLARLDEAKTRSLSNGDRDAAAS